MEHKKLAYIPYGIQGLSDMIKEGYAYVDKTRYIELLENNGTLFNYIIRPRRFGKTVFTGMLEQYYDISQVDNFDVNFAGCYIARHKTALASSFYILAFNFAGIAHGNTVQNLTEVVKSSIQSFIQRYKLEDAYYLIDKEFNFPALLIDEFFSVVKEKIRNKIYVTIDEYDQFAIELFHFDYKKLTSTFQYLQDFYTILKTNTAKGWPIARVFITGVTSISLKALASGFDILCDISNHPAFASMFGFTENELKEFIPKVIDLKKYGHSAEEILKRIKVRYLGYNFCPTSHEIVFSPADCLYYLDEIRSENREPERLIASGFTPSLSTLHKFLSKVDPENVYKTITQAFANKSIEFDEIKPDFKYDNQGKLDHTGIISTLFCFGFLTWKKNSYSLQIPNRSIAQLLYNYYFKYLHKINEFRIIPSLFTQAFTQLKQGNPELFLHTFTKEIDDIVKANHDQKTIQQDIAMAVAYTASFSHDFKVLPEFEITGKEKGYADLVLTPLDGINCSYIFELKYLPVSKANDDSVQEKLTEARAQLDRYCQGDNIASLPNLKRVACVFVGTDIAKLEVC